MQRAIDSFFKKTTPNDASSGKGSLSCSKKRKATVIEEDEHLVSNVDLESKSHSSKKTRTGQKESSEVLRKPLFKPHAEVATDLKAVDPNLLFGGKTLRAENKELKVSVKKQADCNTDTLSRDDETHSGYFENDSNTTKKLSPNQQSKLVLINEGNKDDMNNSNISDEDRHERKRLAGILYQKYKNRSTAINPGSKEIPKGKPNCLAGLSFLVTGILESVEREEINSIIKEYGGKVMRTVGKKLNYLIVGEEAGPKKLTQAEELNIKRISEDDFLNLILQKSKLHEISVETKDLKSSVTIADNKIKRKIKEPQLLPAPETIQRETRKLNSTEQVNPNEAWVDKYKPTTIKEIIGQQGAASNVAKLLKWLSMWYLNRDNKTKIQRPSPWAKNDDGSYYKAALLSGPPGVGKTTTAHLVCKELKFDVVEFNASDTRSKRLLKDEVSELLSNKSLYGYFNGNEINTTQKHVLIMDEVDGMAGNEDRGGIQELIGLIKETLVPIICICNDRNNQKMRSLVNYCYDLRFAKPRLEQIKGRLMSICYKENLKIQPPKINEIIEATNNDIRQCINYISLLSVSKQLESCSLNENNENAKTPNKDLKVGPWEVVRKVFSAEEHKHMSIDDKLHLFFHDYSLGPLFVQENYLQVSPSGPRSSILEKVALAADSLSLGDMVDKRIRSNSTWSLLPVQGIFSSVLPGEYMSGFFTGQINFPNWLGKNSRASKRSRLAQELHNHTRLKTSGSRNAIRLDYASFLLSHIIRPLTEKGFQGVEDSLKVLKEYHLLREDIESLIELTSWPSKKNLMDTVDGRVKASLTRAYNKEVLAYSYSSLTSAKVKKADPSDGSSYEMENEQQENINFDTDEEKEDKLEADDLFKKKKKNVPSKGKPKKK